MQTLDSAEIRRREQAHIQAQVERERRTKANAMRNKQARNKRRDKLISVLLLLGYVKVRSPFVHRGETPAMYSRKCSNGRGDIRVVVWQKKSEMLVTAYPNVGCKSYKMSVENMAYFVLKHADKVPDV